jgi:hypothetical protein
MRWLILILLVFSLPLAAGTVCHSSFGRRLCLTIPDSVDLGGLPASEISFSSDGELDLPMLGPVTVEVNWQRRGLASLFTASLYLRLAGYSAGARPGGLEWKLEDETTFHRLPTTGDWERITDIPGGSSRGTVKLDFRFVPTYRDPPGEASATVELKLALDSLFSSMEVVNSTQLSWSITAWCALSVPQGEATVYLGEVGPGLYDPEADSWQSLSSSAKRLFLATNVPQGLALGVSASSQGELPVDLSRLYVSCCSQPGMSLESPRTLFTATEPGVYKLTGIVYRYQPDFTDAPGDYMVTVTYTLTAP